MAKIRMKGEFGEVELSVAEVYAKTGCSSRTPSLEQFVNEAVKAYKSLEVTPPQKEPK